MAQLSEKKFYNIKCVLILSTTLSKTFLVLRRIKRGIVKNIKMFSREYILFLLDFKEN
jgi:hypothetical protein